MHLPIIIPEILYMVFISLWFFISPFPLFPFFISQLVCYKRELRQSDLTLNGVTVIKALFLVYIYVALFGLCKQGGVYLPSPPSRMATVAQFTTEQAMRLLDFSSKVDMPLLDAVVNCFYSTVGPEVSLQVSGGQDSGNWLGRGRSRWRREGGGGGGGGEGEEEYHIAVVFHCCKVPHDYRYPTQSVPRKCTISK